jgi:small subunit ribosomal protein S6
MIARNTGAPALDASACPRKGRLSAGMTKKGAPSCAIAPQNPATPVASHPDPCFTPASSLPGGDGIAPGYARHPRNGVRRSPPRATSQREHIMPLYECVLIARNDVTQQQVEGIADGIATQLETEGGEMKKREYWGLRGLSYRIKKNRKGHYMLLGLDAKPAFVTEMERLLGLNEDILRFMTVRVEEIEEAPSAILSRKSDERERGFRGPKPAGRFESGRRRGYDDREEFRARDEFREDFRLGVEE